MKSDKKIFFAFLLNLLFSVFEFFGGAITGSVAIMSDAVHDLGDAAGIGCSWMMERKSKQKPDEIYTYGYTRYSVLGSFITTMILIIGSVQVIGAAIGRIIEPTQIHYDGMLLFAVIGVAVNLCAAWLTREGESMNQKAVNLHMLEDVLGWIVVLVGALVMRFTDITLLDPIMSIGVALYILWHAVHGLKPVLALFLERAPDDVSMPELKTHLLALDGVADVHHMHIRSIDGYHHTVTMHVVTERDFDSVKKAVRQELQEHGICHATLEMESPDTRCDSRFCGEIADLPQTHHHHHHHHHH